MEADFHARGSLTAMGGKTASTPGKARHRDAEGPSVLCGKYSSTLRKVLVCSPQGTLACCLFLISLDTFLFYKLFH